jgi:hypothetical protein
MVKVMLRAVGRVLRAAKSIIFRRTERSRGGDVGNVVDKDAFYELFKDRAVVVTDLPNGVSRNLAIQANDTEGRRDVALRTKAEYSTLFDLLVRDLNGGGPDFDQAVTDYQKASRGKDEFFDQDMYMIHVTGFPLEHQVLTDAVPSPDGARLELWRTDPRDQRHIAPCDEEGVLFSTSTFSLMNSGNRTLSAPKSSWKINFKGGEGDNRLVGMARLNLKSMYNDSSQMREALVWDLFDRVGVPSSRHTYAKLAFDASYKGLFSVIEQVDKRFLRDHFGKNDRGNLYKAYCGDLGCATLEHRTAEDGDDSGRQYFTPDAAKLTYRLKTNQDTPEAKRYDDLAQLIRTINGVGLPGGDDRFDTDAFRESVDRILNARAFLRWASVNLLVGSWDNYFATPSNYYLYNSGRQGGERDFVDSPYFTFIPWDYDNSLGIDYFDTPWQYTDILDWPSNTARYWENGRTSRIPLVQNLLRNRDYRSYYLDHIEYVLDTEFNPDSVAPRIGFESEGGLWGRIHQAAYLESDTPYGSPFTGRQFTNDEVYVNGCKQNELRHQNQKIEGIIHYVRMRYDSARTQLEDLRATMPRGSSGASFSQIVETLPARS